MREDIGLHKGSHQLYSPMLLQLRRQSGGPLQAQQKGVVNTCLHATPTHHPTLPLHHEIQ
jgi:hypothetical protein